MCSLVYWHIIVHERSIDRVYYALSPLVGAHYLYSLCVALIDFDIIAAGIGEPHARLINFAN